MLGSRSQRKLKIGLETPHRRQPVGRLHPLPCELCRVRGKVRVKIEKRTVGEKTLGNSRNQKMLRPGKKRENWGGNKQQPQGEKRIKPSGRQPTGAGVSAGLDPKKKRGTLENPSLPLELWPPADGKKKLKGNKQVHTELCPQCPTLCWTS